MTAEFTSLKKRILLSNNQLIAVNKVGGEPHQPDKSADKSLLEKVQNYCKHPVHAVNRLDRPASGVALFAKSKNSMTALSKQFADANVGKHYFAIVSNAWTEQQGELRHWISHNRKINKSFVHSEKVEDSKAAYITFKLLAKSDNYALLGIDLHSGRHHQIRAQLASVGFPIKGDVKYGGRRGNKDRSIHLHANELTFSHPITKERITVNAPLPASDPLWQFFHNTIESLNGDQIGK